MIQVIGERNEPSAGVEGKILLQRIPFVVYTSVPFVHDPGVHERTRLKKEMVVLEKKPFEVTR